MDKALKIAHFMREHDKVAVWLGVDLLEVRPGYARVAITVREDMLNAAGVCQGGVTFSLADFAFAVASNSHGKLALAVSAQIYYPASSRLGDRLIAEAREVNLTEKTGIYEVEVRKEDGTLVAFFTGQVVRRDMELKVD
ncbi:hydroxyphenylacetyl-CoA thioesterase PaaI [Thermosulfurimonas dismutans]|uniref:Phenylacetic acid degradation protein PaaD, thioesterase n=1 Tax=Thermosulfurimonas dismutans TaxID=999894 RepID=A0A179D4T0_9BACT|nr:hydroxyphenylacetyl-CoA thioesterase PaaI [Thermosulfurimonas dismutans]OAQ20729.1 Phenylacetic acid degradation protein PaaD, thioesterase [Thermosulfurimonas dismutans]